MDAILLLFGICGLYYWWKKKEFPLLLSFTGGVMFLFIIAYYGSHTDFFAQLQPQRFTIPLNTFLIIPASAGMLLIFQTLSRGRSVPATFFIGSLIVVVLVGPVAKPLKAIYRYNFYRLSCKLPIPLKRLLNWLETTTNREGRILLEDSEFSKETPQHEYYGGHFPALFPEYVKREYLCGPRPMYPIKHSYASFTDGVLFEKRIETYSLKQLKQHFNLYNVKWIVCWNKKSKDFFNKYPDYIVKKAEIDKFTIYEVKRKSSFFLKGRGIVKSDYNRLELNQIVAEDSEIIISYHFMKYLKTKPAGKLERVFLGDDPIGFIRIVDPPRSLSIYNGY
jgi:hypothetical protein